MIKSLSDVIFLSSLMKDITKLSSLNKEVLSSDFSDIIYYDIYKEIVKFIIDNTEVSYSTLKFKFKSDPNSLEIIEEMIKGEFVTDNLSDAYEELINNSQIKRLRDLSKRIERSCESGRKASNILANVESDILKISSSSNLNLVDINDIEDKVISSISTRMQRFRKTGELVVDMSTGFPKLDQYILGFNPGSTYLLGASTSDGKTQMAVQMTDSVINSGFSALYFLLEDEREKLFYRFLSLRSGIKLFNIICGNITDNQFNTLQKVINNYKQGNKLFIDDTTSEINDIINKIRFAKLKHPNLGFVVVDYIGLTTDREVKYNNREQELSAVSKKLLNTAKACDVAILKISQLNTNPEDRSKGMSVRMNDIRDSKAPGHDASVSIFINYPNKNKEDTGFSKREAELILAKNRYGETNKIIKLINMASVSKFVEE